MNVTQIYPIAGVPEELIRTLNARFREISLSGAAAESAQQFRVNDNGLTYRLRDGRWIYASGVLTATFAKKPRVDAADAGLLWNVSDYAHLLRWTGTAWEWVDAPGNYIAHFAAAPQGNGWQYCDGTATTYLSIAAGVVSEAAFTPPNIPAFAGTGLYLKLGGTYTGTRNIAQTPTMGGSNSNPAKNVALGAVNVPDPPHIHPITLIKDPIDNLIMLPYYRR